MIRYVRYIGIEPEHLSILPHFRARAFFDQVDLLRNGDYTPLLAMRNSEGRGQIGIRVSVESEDPVALLRAHQRNYGRYRRFSHSAFSRNSNLQSLSPSMKFTEIIPNFNNRTSTSSFL
jgi:hypothetical protein